jgi:hypothetical protein
VTRLTQLEPHFVDEIPAQLTPGKLHISITYGTIVHLCCCGCGSEVVTPLHPTRWALTYDGDTVSLWPSVGSWNLPCQSHYVIKRNEVRWARKWSREEIEAGRAFDRAAADAYFAHGGHPSETRPERDPKSRRSPSLIMRRWLRLRRQRTQPEDPAARSDRDCRQ